MGIHTNLQHVQENKIFHPETKQKRKLKHICCHFDFGKHDIYECQISSV